MRLGVYLVDVAHEAEIHLPRLARRGIGDRADGPAMDRDQRRVDAREPDRRHLGLAKRGQQIGIDRAGKGHLRHFQRVAAGDSAPRDDFRRHAEAAAEVGGLWSAAVDQHHLDAKLMQHGDLVGQIGQRRSRPAKAAAELDDENPPLVGADVRHRDAKRFSPRWESM